MPPKKFYNKFNIKESLFKFPTCPKNQLIWAKFQNLPVFFKKKSFWKPENETDFLYGWVKTYLF